MQDSFVIGQTEFGIDRSKLELAFLPDDKGQVEVNISIRGNEQLFEQLTDNEDSPWSWALYPPVFNLTAFRISQDVVASLPVNIPKQTEKFEMALYMMEHCELRSVVLQRNEDSIVVEGIVDVFGEDKPLRIHLANAFAD